VSKRTPIEPNLNAREEYIVRNALLFGKPENKDIIRRWNEYLQLNSSNPYAFGEYVEGYRDNMTNDDISLLCTYVRGYHLYKDLEKVSPTEAQVVVLYRSGKTPLEDKDIVAKLGLNKNTLKTHFRRVMRKLGVSYRIDLIVQRYSPE
jgi:DNA-binding CsgD family transcriptional regulator